MTTSKPLTYLFKDDGKVPNNQALPVLVYKGAIDARRTRHRNAVFRQWLG